MDAVRLLAVLLALAGAVPAHVPHDPVLDVALSPGFEHDRTLFVAVEGFPLVLRSTNGGESFETVHAGLSHPYQRHIVISPDFETDRRLWVSDGLRIHETRDAGESWRELTVSGQAQGVSVLDLDLSPGGGALLLATSRGLFSLPLVAEPEAGGEPPAPALLLATGHTLVELALDAEGGRVAVRDAQGVVTGRLHDLRWQRLVLPEGEGVTALHAGHRDGQGLLFAGTRTGEVWLARFDDGSAPGDGGPAPRDATPGPAPGLLAVDWRRQGAALPGDEVLDIDSAPAGGGALVVLATTRSGGIHARGLDQDDAAWDRESEGLRELSSQGTKHFLLVRPTPGFAEDHHVFAGTFEGLYERVGDGPWRTVETLPRRTVRDLALSPGYAEDGRIWLAGYGDGLIQSDDRGLTWRVIESSAWTYPDGIAGSAPLPRGAEDPEQSPAPSALFVGTPNRHLLSQDGGRRWKLTFKEMGGFADDALFAPDYATSGELFVRLLYYKESGHTELWLTRDRGQSWEVRGPKLVSDLVLAPDYPTSGELYLATGAGLLISPDRGGSYRRMECPLESAPVAVAVADGPAGRLVAAATQDVVVTSTDGGATWTVAAVPAQVKFLSAGTDGDGAFHLFAGTFTDGLFVSRDDGESFATVGGGPQLVIDLDIASDFARSPTVIAAGYHGPWISRDAGATWELLRFGPDVPDGVLR